MAAVYLAEQKSLARRVAIKVLNADLAKDATYVDRFEHEARSAASLVHAHIVQVYEVGVIENRHFLSQEYVPGGTLGQLIQREGPLSPAKTIVVLWQVAEALSVAAERGLVHRDIKPDNLMLDRTGAVKVADFGLARLSEAATPRMTREGLTIGTPLYMSPEQIEGREVDSRSDLYSLGVTAYHLLTGEPPFDGDTALAVAVRHLNEEPASIHTRRDSLPGELAHLVHRLMAKSPDDRYASPTELLDSLSEIMSIGESAGWIDPQLSGSRLIQSRGVYATAENEDTRKLAEAMRASTLMDRASGTRWRRARLALIGVVAGVLLATILRPGSLLPRVDRTAVRHEASVKAQLFRAKIVDTPEAWAAVESYFPEGNEFDRLLAQRGYVMSCFRANEFRRAMPALDLLISREADYPNFSAFAQAGLIVSHFMLGDEQRARDLLGGIDRTAVPEDMRPYFNRVIQRMNSMGR